MFLKYFESKYYICIMLLNRTLSLTMVNIKEEKSQPPGFIDNMWLWNVF